MDLKVSLAVFEGPLDLLLHLVRREELSIYDIPIARITDQYLQYLRQMTELDLEIASEFLVMAATLLQIKARMLLPRPPKSEGEVGEEEADPRQMLVEQLLEYKRYKEAADELSGLAAEEALRFSRPPVDIPAAEPGLPDDLDLARLMSALRSLLAEAEPTPPPAIRRDSFTIRQRMDFVLARLSESGSVAFRSLFGLRFTRGEVVATFLAVLELVRNQLVAVRQTTRLGEIEIELRQVKAG